MRWYLRAAKGTGVCVEKTRETLYRKRLASQDGEPAKVSAFGEALPRKRKSSPPNLPPLTREGFAKSASGSEGDGMLTNVICYPATS